MPQPAALEIAKTVAVFRNRLLIVHCPEKGCAFSASVVDDWKGNGQQLIDRHMDAHTAKAHLGEE